LSTSTVLSLRKRGILGIPAACLFCLESAMFLAFSLAEHTPFRLPNKLPCLHVRQNGAWLFITLLHPTVQYSTMWNAIANSKHSPQSGSMGVLMRAILCSSTHVSAFPKPRSALVLLHNGMKWARYRDVHPTLGSDPADAAVLG